MLSHSSFLVRSAFVFLLLVHAFSAVPAAADEIQDPSDPFRMPVSGFSPLPDAETDPALCTRVGRPTFAEGMGETGENRESPGAEGDEFKPVPLEAVFGEGFAVESRDKQYQLRIRTLTQIDSKIFLPTDQDPARSGIYIPRFRIYFEGQLTDLFEYELSLQRSVEGQFDVLDANVDFVPSEQFKVRVGRALVPYSYAWYDHLEQYYITPERGLYALNFGLARQAGLFAHGKLFEKQLQYALGGTFGQLDGLADTNTTRDGIGYVNLRPFLHAEDVSWLRFLNVGASMALGRQAYESTPLPLRTSVQTSENDEAAQAASSIFLEYENGVVAKGQRLQGAFHTALYSGPFSFEAEWYAARFGVAPSPGATSVNVPIFGYDLTLGYFLTGETVEGRKTVAPLRPVTKESNGWGALELFGRYSSIRLGSQVFTAGLANQHDWTDSVGMTDIGANWYLTRFVRLTFDWQHAMYATPVLLNEAKDLRSKQNDLFWMRCQLYF